MSVYVDPAVWPFHSMVMCHMLADTAEELHAMADRIGIQRLWFQNKPGSTPHYDICKSKRERAIRQGAIEISREQLVEIMRKLRNPEEKRKYFSGNSEKSLTLSKPALKSGNLRNPNLTIEPKIMSNTSIKIILSNMATALAAMAAALADEFGGDVSTATVTVAPPMPTTAKPEDEKFNPVPPELENKQAATYAEAAKSLPEEQTKFRRNKEELAAGLTAEEAKTGRANGWTVEETLTALRPATKEEPAPAANPFEPTPEPAKAPEKVPTYEEVCVMFQPLVAANGDILAKAMEVIKELSNNTGLKALCDKMPEKIPALLERTAGLREAAAKKVAAK